MNTKTALEHPMHPLLRYRLEIIFNSGKRALDVARESGNFGFPKFIAYSPLGEIYRRPYAKVRFDIPFVLKIPIQLSLWLFAA